MITRVFIAFILAVSTVLLALAHAVHDEAQGGDQFLDGIGETGLVARYLLNGNAEDSARNQFHAALRGSGGTFVEDGQVRRVLLLTGDGSHLQLPGGALAGEDTISVTGWLFLPTGASGHVFDFGQNASNRLFAEASRAGFRASIVVGGTVRGETAARPVLENQWAHIAVVLDPASRVLTTYLDGARVRQATDVAVNATQIVSQTAANRLFIGRSQADAEPTLHGRLRDIRIYRIALTDQQVGAIRNNALGRQSTGRRGPPAPVISTAAIPKESPLASRLANVPDITVETIVGMLPRLPATIPAVYRDASTPLGAGLSTTTPGERPEVRVIWPSPTDNSEVRAPGSYSVTGKVPGTPFEPKATVIVKVPVGTTTPPSRLAEAFPLSQVLLERDTKNRETAFIKNRDKFIRGLAASNPDNFLYNFRDAFGQPQPAGAQQLEGWDNQTTRLRGHASGHYLTAIAQAYASTTYDEALRANFLGKMNYLIDTLYDLSRKSGRPAEQGGPFVADPTAVPPGPGRKGYDSNLRADAIRTDYWNWGVGFISAYPPDQFIMLEKGATYGTQDTQIWAPYYTLHKILAGLLDSYEVGGNSKALEVAKGMGTWVFARLNALPAETRISMWNRYIAGEYGGSNEVMARLFRLTGDRQFLQSAKLFDNTSLFFGNAGHEHGLAKNVDTIRGKHANQHIPQITGALETFRGTKELPYYLIAANFWDMVNRGYMYSIGGVAGARVPNNAECFTAQPNTLWENGFANGGQNETCATYNLLKLDRQLFMYDQTAKYMDHYERALYNHILASVAEEDPGNTYHVPLNPGAQKRFGNARMNGFTCCNGTALESNTKLQDTIYFRSADNRTLYVNLFVPSTLDWSERKVVVQQMTDFPYADTTRLVVKGSGQFEIKVRVPRWATRGFFVKINGREQQLAAVPGTYMTIARTWRANDTIELRMPFHFYLDHVVDQPNVASIFYGPVLLALEEAGPRTDWRQVTLDASDIGKSITGDPSTLRFTVDGAVLKPFYETYGRHSVYVHVTLK
ncbi:MAG TPA: beta-L-arabinofuranosidase domain-containing protein [Vicinamibacterales bacterium]|nr:beta-L-arabinofuranosidase domain-containing protein [Vicinamibacterales bacterium]